jgi:hypothetical protein
MQVVKTHGFENYRLVTFVQRALSPSLQRSLGVTALRATEGQWFLCSLSAKMNAMKLNVCVSFGINAFMFLLPCVIRHFFL